MVRQREQVLRRERLGIIGREALRLLADVVVSVDLDVLLPFCWDLVLSETGVDWTCLYACVAVNTFLGIDVELRSIVIVRRIRRRMDTVDWAHFDTRVVLGADARFRDDIGRRCPRGVRDGIGGVTCWTFRAGMRSTAFPR